MRQLFVYCIFSVCLLMVWYNYAPPAQRAVLPEKMQTAIIGLDAAFTRGVAVTSTWMGHRINERRGHAATAEDSDAVWVATAEDGINLVYENAPIDSDHLPSSDTLFLGASLNGANLSKAALKNALMDGADARDASFVDANLSGASARLSVFKGAIFHRADLTAVTMQRADFDHAILVDSQLRDAQFSKAHFVSTHIRGGSAIGARFDRAIVTHALFEQTDLRRASFVGASLQGTRLVEVQLHGTRFDGANLSGTDLSRSTGLTQLSLSGACGDATTRLPAGLSVLPCPSQNPATLATHSPADQLAYLATYHSPAGE